MRIYVAQLNPVVGDIDGNTQKILHCLSEARKQKAEIVLFAEMTICGYAPDDLLLHRTFIDSMEQHLEKIVRYSKDLMVFVGLVRRNLLLEGEKNLYNSCAVIKNGRLLGFYDKWLLPNYDVFEEMRYFEPGEELGVWEYKGKKIGVIICEDIWQHAGYVEFTRYSRDPILALADVGIDLLLNLSASPYQFQKSDKRVNVCSKAAKTLQCPVILCCQVGGNGQLLFDGYSVYVNAKGELERLGKGFEEECMLIDLEAKSSARTYKYDPLQDVYQALLMGVRDYFTKHGFTKACLGLSGGIDSALVAKIAVDALGAKNVCALKMPSMYSSKEGLEDADQLVQNLQIECHTIPIQSPFDSYQQLLAPYFEGKKEDVTEENLQARIRGMILMAFSNKLGYIVLSTGNKSEGALGYSTLYGDMCGGLSVLGDVKKTLVYDLARWINQKEVVIPKRIIDKPPSAELSIDQKDSDHLPDYEVIDNVLEGYVEDYLTMNEIAVKYQISLEIVMDLIQRIHKAEYKRRQGPPNLRVSKKSFGVGRRYPIVQNWL